MPSGVAPSMQFEERPSCTGDMVPPEGKPPGPHPLPTDIDRIELPVITFDRDWFRFHRMVRDPLHFGKSGNNRFDAPAGGFGVLYLSADVAGAFLETFGRGHAGSSRLVTEATLRERTLARVTFERPIRLVDLTGAGLVRLGADHRLTSGDYHVSQHWSGQLRNHPDAPDGLFYRARHDPSKMCAAVFDNVDDQANASRLGSLLDDGFRGTLGAILDRYDFGLD